MPDDPPAKSDRMIRMPSRRVPALVQIQRRLLIAAGLIVFIALIALIQRNGYVDSSDGKVGVVDAMYYAAVSVTTTGYGDITPASTSARFVDVLLVTPARIAFLVVLVGTTMEVLTDQTRQAFAARRWRKNVHDHYVICGYGSTGASAVRALRAQGIDPGLLVVIEPDPEVAARAAADGLVVIESDATRQEALAEAEVSRARAVIVTPNRDDTAVLITLTVREANPDATIVTGVRDAENLHLLRQSGADSVIHSADAVGRLLGLATTSATVASVMDDLLLPGSGFDVLECDPVPQPDGSLGPPARASVLAVIRNGAHRRPDQLPGGIEAGDRLVVLRSDPAGTERPAARS
jgi:voltage-gated potassium channel